MPTNVSSNMLKKSMVGVCFYLYINADTHEKMMWIGLDADDVKSQRIPMKEWTDIGDTVNKYLKRVAESYEFDDTVE